MPDDTKEQTGQGSGPSVKGGGASAVKTPADSDTSGNILGSLKAAPGNGPDFAKKKPGDEHATILGQLQGGIKEGLGFKQ